MKAKVQVSLGKTVVYFEFDEKNDMEALHRVGVFGYPPTYCNCCQSSGAEFFAISSNKDKEGNIYVSILCKKCGAKAKLGQYKSGGFFWHKFEVYKKQGEEINQPEGDYE